MTPLSPHARSTRAGACHLPARGQTACPVGLSVSDAGVNIGLSVVIPPCRGSHHQLPAERGWCSLARCSWRWKEQMALLAQIPARLPGRCGWSGSLCQEQDAQVRRPGATSLPSRWSSAYGGVWGAPTMASLWCLSPVCPSSQRDPLGVSGPAAEP